MQGELDNLIDLINSLHILTPEINQSNLRKALGIFMAAFPIYRIYPDSLPLSTKEFGIIESAYEVALQYESSLREELTAIINLFVYDDKTCEQKLKCCHLLRSKPP